MVLKGQFLERPALIPVGGEVLEGLSHRGRERPPLLILPPPPEEGGSMDHIVAAELAWAAATAGFPTLRFNFRGVGASQGRHGTPADQAADTRAALQLLADNTGTQEVVVSSIGGSAALGLELALQLPARGLVLVSPDRIAPESIAAFPRPLVVAVAELDTRLDRAALSEAVNRAGGRLVVVEKTDATFARGLPLVGRAAVHLLKRLAPTPT
ncbi:MAG TPA: alpha/beta hydrolase [Myxococcales bacterium]|nr:alpha/beta hydrolase [Myxococcales bacterium]